MATRPSEHRELLERWKADHPDLVPNGRPAPPAPRPRVPPPPPAPLPRDAREEQRAMIERWKAEHPELSGGRAQPQPRPPETRGSARSEAGRSADEQTRMIDIANTPLTVLSAFIIGCILGGVAMTIITGIAFWSFSGG